MAAVRLAYLARYKGAERRSKGRASTTASNAKAADSGSRAPKSIFDSFPLVVITWRDHTATVPDTWASREDLDSLGVLATVTSIGWLYKETDDQYVLVSCADRDLREFSAIQTIGKAMTIQIKHIKGKFK